ncbi:MAG: o-succinylbenzoate synthase, partial [Verrucomicrobia bacterium]|nr:o-succinylbenzoate synthase [Verrucomicrobiota bacterium]
EWIAEARQRGIDWWITSALESNIGLNAIAHFCASIISPIDSQTLPQGLGTGQLFLDNIPLPLEIDQARLWFHSEKEPDIHSIIQTVLQK